MSTQAHTTPRRQTRGVPLVLAVTLLSACGGSEDLQTLPRTELSSTDKRTVQGDWPSNRTYLLVKDQQFWDQVWGERKAYLGCDAGATHPACSLQKAPEFDFTKYELVGLSFNTRCKFSKPADYVRVEEKSGVRTVEFDVTCILPNQPPYAEFTSEFFLLPRGTGSYTFQASGT